MARSAKGKGTGPAPGRPQGPRTRPPHRPAAIPWWQRRGALTGAVVAVVVVVGIFIAVAQLGGKGGGGTPAAAETPVPAAVLDAVTRPQPGVLAAVGTGGLPTPLQALPSGTPPLRGSGGKPEVLYVGADYCPFCAAERWSLVLALSRFGSFSNLHLMTSSSTDVFPDTPTFTFFGSSYTSQYLQFVPVETETRDQAPLQTPTPAQQALVNAFDGPPFSSTSGGIPFVDFGNRWVAISSGFSPGVLDGMTWQQIAAALSNPNAASTRAIAGNANQITAAICALTGNQPAAACAAAPVPQLANSLPTSAP